MDRNPSPPSSDAEDEQAAGDSIGNTVYSKHWLFSILTKLIEVISPDKSDSNLNREEVQTELDEEMENDIYKVWDMSMDEDLFFSLKHYNCVWQFPMMHHKEQIWWILKETLGAGDMWHAYSDMREANYKNADKYFHARGNYYAAQRGPGGKWAAEVISDARERWQSDISGRGAEDTRQDQEANEWGRSGKDPNHYRPKGLPLKY